MAVSQTPHTVTLFIQGVLHIAKFSVDENQEQRSEKVE